MRLTEFLDAVATALRNSNLFVDVRVHLDPYDLGDVTVESFKAPAARVLFTVGKPAHRANGSMDLDCTVSIAVITKRTGRADPAFASADVAALNLTLAACQVVQDNPYFGLGKLTAAQVEGIKVAVSEKANEKGLAITVILFRSTLLEVVIEREAIGQLIGTRLPGPAVELPPSLSEIAEFEDDGF